MKNPPGSAGLGTADLARLGVFGLGQLGYGQLCFQIAPFGFGPAVGPDDPGGGAGIDPATRDEALANIAAAILDLETLEPRKRDSLDFHELGVWAIKKALEAAYEAGREAK